MSRTSRGVFLSLACFNLFQSLCTASAIPRRQAASVIYTTKGPVSLPSNLVTSTQSVAAPSTIPDVQPFGQPAWDLTTLDVEHDGPLSLQVALTGGNTTSSAPYGVILEDIDHCIDGGLYAELVQNRAFQTHTLDSWLPVGGASISLGYEEPLTSALSAHLTVDLAASGYGFENTGWWGFSVRPVPYRASFWARTTSTTNFKINLALVGAATSALWVSVDVVLTGPAGEWTFYETYLTPATSAPDNNNEYVIKSINDVADTVDFQLISLFPPTYNNRTHGVRPDLMQNLVDLNLKFCRVPGGNNLEGSTIKTRFIWNETIGPLRNRPGHVGTWGYFNTDGMGLLEWAQFCEDLGSELLLGVYGGYSLNQLSVAEADLDAYITEVINEIEYLVGDASSTYGSLRVSHGQTKPFNLTYVEIGNEDFFSSTYYYRFPAYYAQLKAAYPNITFVATTDKGIILPAGVVWDQHQYGAPQTFEGLFGAYDNWPRNNGTSIIIGEYAVDKFDDYSAALYPFMEGSAAEAVYNIGNERNGDVVLTQLYAPFFANVHYNQEGRTRLITFDNDPSNTIFSTSYYVLQLLSTHVGTTSLPVTANLDFFPLYWSASQDPASGTVYVKIANVGASPQDVDIAFIDATLTFLNGTVISGDQTAANTPADPTAVVPVSLSVTSGSDGSSTFTIPAWGVAVAAFKA